MPKHFTVCIPPDNRAHGRRAFLSPLIGEEVDKLSDAYFEMLSEIAECAAGPEGRLIGTGVGGWGSLDRLLSDSLARRVTDNSLITYRVFI